MSIDAMKRALEALEYIHTETTEDEDELIHAAIASLRLAIEQAEKQEPVACSVCKEVHAILDADESQIIRNAKDGYPDGRKPRILTLQERVNALCVYASDWKRWCLEKENAAPPQQEKQEPVCICELTCVCGAVWCGEELVSAPPQRQPLTEEEITHLWETLYDHGNGKYEGGKSQTQRARAFEILKRIGGDHE